MDHYNDGYWKTYKKLCESKPTQLQMTWWIELDRWEVCFNLSLVVVYFEEAKIEEAVLEESRRLGSAGHKYNQSF